MVPKKMELSIFTAVLGIDSQNCHLDLKAKLNFPKVREASEEGARHANQGMENCL